MAIIVNCVCVLLLLIGSIFFFYYYYYCKKLFLFLKNKIDLSVITWKLITVVVFHTHSLKYLRLLCLVALAADKKNKKPSMPSADPNRKLFTYIRVVTYFSLFEWLKYFSFNILCLHKVFVYLECFFFFIYFKDSFDNNIIILKYICCLFEAFSKKKRKLP